MPQQKRDSFVPDSFTPDNDTDSFEPDSFTPDTEDEGFLSSLWHGASDPLSNLPSRLAKSASEYIDPAQGNSGLRSIASAYLESLGHAGDSMTSPISLALMALTGGTGMLAKAGMPTAAKVANYGIRGLSTPIAAHGVKSAYEGYEHGSPAEFAQGVLEAGGGGLGMFSHVPSTRPRARVPDEVLPPEAPPTIRGLLPEHRDPFIVGESGVAQRESLVTPQERMRLQGIEIGEDGPVGRNASSPPDRWTDLGELRERERQANLDYTDHEHMGGSALELERSPNMDIPPESGDTRLGFSPESNANLEYPLNVVPNRLRPRIAQSMVRGLAGDDFAAPVEPNRPLQFESERPTPQTAELPETDLMGGTRALEPNEPILPSAPKKTRTAPHIQEQEMPLNETPYEDKVGNYTRKNVDPAIAGASKEVEPIIAQNKSTFRRLAEGLFISGERQLEKMGVVGTEIRRVLSATEYSKRELFNKFADPFIKATSTLVPEEIANFVDAMDGVAPPMGPNVAIAVKQARHITDMMAKMAQEAGVHVKTSKGEVVPFKGLKEYWPHRPVNPVGRSSFIDELIKNNPKLSRSQAERLAKQFQNESEFFNSPQHSRMFGNFEYRKDLNAMIDHMADMADIISRAKVLGPGDIGQRGSMISQLIEKAPDPVRAHELVRTHLRGGLDKNDSFYQAVKTANRVATKSQVFTKLGMFPISNLNNQLQTMIHGNLDSFAQAFGQALSGSPTLKSLAKEYGTVSVGELPVGILSEAGKRQVPIVGPMVKWAEDFARTVATGTGKGTAEAVFKTAKAGDKQSISRLQNLLLQDDVAEVLKQPKLTADQTKFATQRFVELAQQLDSGMKLPPAWVNEPLLHIPLIFKRFGFQGTKSIKDAIMSDPKRNIPVFLVAAPLLGELTGDLKSIVYGVIRGAPAPDGMLEAIAFELAGRHNFAGKLTGLDSEEGDIEWVANRLTADIIQSWGLGLVADMMQGALGGKNAGYSALFGPAIDQALSVITGIGQMDGTQLGRESLRSVPVVGPGLQRRILPTASQEMPE